MKVGFVIGHNSSDKGSFSKALNISEYDFFEKVANKIKSCSKKHKVEVIKREFTGGYTKEMSKVVDYVNSNSFDLVFELHFNAYNGVARGIEMLYFHKSSKGKEISQKLMSLHNSIIGLPERRIIPISESTERGGYGIVKSKMPYVLTESFFGDNSEDCALVSADKIADVFLEYLGETEVGESTPQTNNDNILSNLGKVEDLIKKIKEEILDRK
ncbi:MAG: N-acetylmuramoyl-L-alanine amidase [Fusobacteriaceae bacterium]